ncbi:Putative Flp pilus-assembly TadG-like, N-terminal [actinobacterium SCGC AAA044-D11]
MRKKFSDIKNEDGAVVALFAILMSSILVIALFVIVFDISALYSERRVIQNAADTSVLATAQECAVGGTGAILNINSAYASGVCGTQSYAEQFAGKYANLNSPDSLSDVSEICGTAPLNQCGSLDSGQYECKSVNSAYKNYVRVKTSTKQSSGNSIKSLFSSLISPNDSDVKVVGCAQSAWGKAAFAPVSFPMALPICDYSLNGTKLIKDFESNNPVVTGGCTVTDLNGDVFNYASPTTGFDLLSGFGCPGVTAPVNVDIGDILQIESSLTQVEGGCPSGSSQFYFQISRFLNTKVFIPVVTSVACQSGSVNCQGNYQFQVASFYSFKFIGGKFKNRGRVGSAPTCVAGDPCQQNQSWPPACDATRNCIYGTFERAIVPGADVSLDPSFPAVGAMAVQLLP